MRLTSDDWPFLYLQPGAFPWGSAAILALVLVGAAFSVRRVFGHEVTGGGFDAPLFFMGAAFLLLETRGITNLSLHGGKRRGSFPSFYPWPCSGPSRLASSPASPFPCEESWADS